MRWGQRLETSRVGQVLLSVAMLVVIACLVLWNLPAGRPHDAVRPLVAPVVQGLGLEQDWALFAPDPRAFSVGLSAAITFSDGHVEHWEPPHNGLVVSPYRTYRWQKYVERARADDYRLLWEQTAQWVAREHEPGVVKVVLTRTFRNVLRPGDPGPRPTAGTFDYYTLELP